MNMNNPILIPLVYFVNIDYWWNHKSVLSQHINIESKTKKSPQNKNLETCFMIKAGSHFPELSDDL